MKITKEQAIGLFGSVKELQTALGLKTHSAIYMWPDGEGIPETHALRIRYQLKPEAFGDDDTLLPSDEASTGPAKKKARAA